MKRFAFILVVILLCACTNRSKPKGALQSLDIKAEAIKELQDSTLNSVYLGLQLGAPKNITMDYLMNLVNEGKIENLQQSTLTNLSDYKCVGAEYLGDSQVFDSKINVLVDSSFYALQVHCRIDFYNEQLYSILLTPTSSDLTIDAVSVALQDMYMENYGIGFTTSSYSTNAQYNEIEVSPWTSEIWECVKHLSQNSTWTTSNVEIVVAKKQSEYKVDEYNETSFYRAYEEAWPECFGELAERKLANKISSKATMIKQRNALRTTNMIVYKSRNIHDEILSVQQLAEEKELQRIKNEARQQEIADSIEQDKMKQEYKNQSI